MKVVDHGPHAWYLLREADTYYFDARVSRSAVDWSVLVELTPQEYREYHFIGKVFLDYLAARIHNFTDEYASRDLTGKLGDQFSIAVREWRAMQ